MAYWVVCRETPPGGGSYVPITTLPVQPDPGGGVAWEQDGLVIFDDGYPYDFSGWGDEESNVVANFQQKLSALDGGVSYGCYWPGPDFVPNNQPQGLMSTAAKKVTKAPVGIVVYSPKVHKKPKPCKPWQPPHHH